MMTQEQFDYFLNLKKEDTAETLKDILEKLNLCSKEIQSANIIEVSVGTTGYKGGDTGHGGRTAFRLHNLCSTDMRVSVDGSELKDVEDVAIVFGGDCELDTFKEALLFAYQTLENIQPKMSIWERIKCAWKYKDLNWLKT